jgi:hypothetical protein
MVKTAAMVFVLRTLVIGIFVAVLAFAAGAISLQQGGPGTTPAAIGSILLLAAVPLGLLVFVALLIRGFVKRRSRPRGGARRAAGRGAAPGGRAAQGARAGARPARPRR